MATPYCVFRLDDDQGRPGFFVGQRSSVPSGAVVLPALERRPLRVRDRVALYRLLASQGKPILRLPDAGAAAQILRAVASRGIQSDDLSVVINDVADTLSGTVSTADVKNVVVLLARSEAMSSEPDDAPLPDRTYTLVAPSRTIGDLRNAVLAVVRDKLEGRLGTVEEDVLEQLIER